MPGYADGGIPFFLSYARAIEGAPGDPSEHNPDQLVERFFRDLRENVAELIPLPVGVDAGFMDRTTVRGGMRWTDELLNAVGHCQMLIALLSARYIKSEWCKLEWDGFAKRKIQRAKNAPASQGCIVPVIWAPMRDLTLPPHIAAEQHFSPSSHPDADVPDTYRHNGIFGLLRTNQVNAYQIVVWELALHISRIYHSQRVSCVRYKTEDQLRDTSRGSSHGAQK